MYACIFFVAQTSVGQVNNYYVPTCGVAHVAEFELTILCYRLEIAAPLFSCKHFQLPHFICVGVIRLATFFVKCTEVTNIEE